MRHQYATPWIWIFLLPLAFDYQATDESFFDLFVRLRETKIIP